MEKKIKTTFISDTHTRHWEISLPGGDLCCMCGDYMGSGYNLKELYDFANWVREKVAPNYSHVVWVAGNHDRALESNTCMGKDMFSNMDNVHYLMNETIELDFPDKGKLRIGGTPYQPDFCHWAFNVEDSDKLDFIYDNVIEEGLNVLLTHCPPFDILDQSHLPRPYFGKTGEERLGSIELRKKILSMDNPPRYHTFGHIHGDGGKHVLVGNTIFINASVCDESYKPVNPIITLDIEPRRG